MNPLPPTSRYARVSRRAVLKATLGIGAAALVPTVACSSDDAEVFAGAATDPGANPTAAPTPTAFANSQPTQAPAETEPGQAEEPAQDATSEPEPTSGPQVAVAGEMVVSFTYTQAAGGKNESPYVAVWLENAAGELVQTVSLWYQLERRGERWLDHLSRWYGVDADTVAAGNLSNASTVSSATREPGSYSVAWDGTADGSAVVAGDYFLCIEAVREDGPYSLIREPFLLNGSLPETTLPDNGELSGASVRIDV